MHVPRRGLHELDNVLLDSTVVPLHYQLEHQLLEGGGETALRVFILAESFGKGSLFNL